MIRHEFRVSLELTQPSSNIMSVLINFRLFLEQMHNLRLVVIDNHFLGQNDQTLDFDLTLHLLIKVLDHLITII